MGSTLKRLASIQKCGWKREGFAQRVPDRREWGALPVSRSRQISIWLVVGQLKRRSQGYGNRVELGFQDLEMWTMRRGLPASQQISIFRQCLVISSHTEQFVTASVILEKIMKLLVHEPTKAHINLKQSATISRWENTFPKIPSNGQLWKPMPMDMER